MTEEHDPARAMATDAAMLAAAETGRPGIRLYRWSAICVTLGRFQAPPTALVDTAAWPWAHRPTGGGAVLHGHDATLSIAVPRSEFRGTRKTYRELAAVVIDLLCQSGFDACLADSISVPPGAPLTPYCFGTTCKCDIIDRSARKLCGCALRLTRRAALLQTSIPMERPLIDPAQVIRCGADNVLPVPLKASIDPQALPSWAAIVAEIGPVSLQHTKFRARCHEATSPK